MRPPMRPGRGRRPRPPSSVSSTWVWVAHAISHRLPWLKQEGTRTQVLYLSLYVYIYVYTYNYSYLCIRNLSMCFFISRVGSLIQISCNTREAKGTTHFFCPQPSMAPARLLLNGRLVLEGHRGFKNIRLRAYEV